MSSLIGVASRVRVAGVRHKTNGRRTDPEDNRSSVFVESPATCWEIGLEGVSREAGSAA